ncbi:YlmC/YmxH family sporulation protein [Paenibacillus sp. JX-17]|uniref:YlmC/YmxH family sporulation protein n=1 Tax=Paenibacillus lacisoli TaxID=3064525 RepID=A0ABT9C935_9BACL|nr:YlmC/YmxH family sporulation protein [Paenibacillus sp. JX-17]MDO7905395.1 YlmC/YmxH family sporulation protein [Paenibacillus sp. JX-17]
MSTEETIRAMKISDFQTKDVINIIDGKRLGHVSDLELDLRQGRIEAIVVPVQNRFMGLFGGGSDLIIPWRHIVKIGSDVVLVRMETPAREERPEERDPDLYLERTDRGAKKNH